MTSPKNTASASASKAVAPTSSAPVIVRRGSSAIKVRKLSTEDKETQKQRLLKKLLPKKKASPKVISDPSSINVTDEVVSEQPQGEKESITPEDSSDQLHETRKKLSFDKARDSVSEGSEDDEGRDEAQEAPVSGAVDAPVSKEPVQDKESSESEDEDALRRVGLVIDQVTERLNESEELPQGRRFSDQYVVQEPDAPTQDQGVIQDSDQEEDEGVQAPVPLQVVPMTKGAGSKRKGSESGGGFLRKSKRQKELASKSVKELVNEVVETRRQLLEGFNTPSPAKGKEPASDPSSGKKAMVTYSGKGVVVNGVWFATKGLRFKVARLFLRK